MTPPDCIADVLRCYGCGRTEAHGHDEDCLAAAGLVGGDKVFIANIAEPDDEKIERLEKALAEAEEKAQEAWSAGLSVVRNKERIKEITEVERLCAEKDALWEALGWLEPWPVTSVLRRMAEGIDHLFDQYNYDMHGHEELSRCRARAREIADAVDAVRRAALGG